MAERQKGMGRGLAAILSVAPKDEHEELRELPTELIEPNPHQPRHAFDEDSLLALAESIRVRGVLQPVLVRSLVGGRYELIAGERRWRAAQKAGLKEVPVVVKGGSETERFEMALVENIQREDLSAVETGNAFHRMATELNLTPEQIGARTMTAWIRSRPRNSG